MISYFFSYCEKKMGRLNYRLFLACSNGLATCMLSGSSFYGSQEQMKLFVSQFSWGFMMSMFIVSCGLYLTGIFSSMNIPAAWALREATAVVCSISVGVTTYIQYDSGGKYWFIGPLLLSIIGPYVTYNALEPLVYKK